MTLLDHDRYCDEIIAQTEQLIVTIADADLSVTVPTCPDWTLAELLRHLGRAHRYAETVVRTRATAPIPFDQVPDAAGPDEDDPAALGTWLAAGAARLVDVLREAGPDTKVWTWCSRQDTAFWARRQAHETVVHRADAALAAGREFTVDPAIAADTVDEFLELLSSPPVATRLPALAELRGPYRSIHLHATDTAEELGAEWLIELGEDGFTWRRSHAKATVAVRGPMADVLQVLYRRLPANSERVEVLGDAKLLDFWLERAKM
ncbi:maleylpyruvate isomerase family mycothiol-dependent enzyme [Streptomyces sp. NPDC004647]|uniref:maleylpyruvate isomerase family mycothiol-dependent enzyme n=1 Tax=Streptomyces sp. NPDC004647 TaxID=3154671 RepID=UPI0033BE0864